MSAINPAFSLTAEDLALVGDEQFGKLRNAVDRLYRLVLADERRRRDEVRSKYEVLGKDTTATCLRHRRLVRWIPAPGWWIHDDDLPHTSGNPTDPRGCSAMWDAKAPIVLVRVSSPSLTAGD